MLAIAILLTFTEGKNIVRSLVLKHRAEAALARAASPAWVSFDSFVDLNINRLGQNVGEFSGKGGTCDLEVLASAEKPNGCLMMSYDVTLPSSFAGYFRAMTGLDLSGLSVLSFEIRGDRGGETCTVELGNESSVRRVPLASILPDGCVKEWRKVRIPLALFGAGGGWWRRAATLSFVFENDTDILWRSAVYVRNVGFER